MLLFNFKYDLLWNGGVSSVISMEFYRPVRLTRYSCMFLMASWVAQSAP